MSRWSSDLRHAWRSLFVRRGSSLATGFVVSLGVGLLSAMFAIADPFVLRPLPYVNPDQLVIIEVGVDGLTPGAPIPSLDEWRSQGGVLQEIAGLGAGMPSRIRAHDEGAIAFSVREVTQDFFRVLGLPGPSGAEWLRVSDDHVPVVLTHTGRERLPPGLRAPGSLLPRHDGGAFMVVGTVSEGFLFPAPGIGHRLDGLAPSPPGVQPLVSVSGWRLDGRPLGTGSRWIARLQPGVTPRMAREALAWPLPSGRRLDVHVEALPERMTREVRPLAWGALGAGLLIVLVCTGNVANLLLARASARGREFATRAALGATRADIARLWLLEVAVLAATAVLLALGIAWAALLAVNRVIPTAYVALGTPSVTLRVVAFAAVVGAVVIALAVLSTAFLWRVAPVVLFGSAAYGSGRIGAPRFLFMAAQSGLAMILVIGAAMLVQSYHNLIRQSTGYDPLAVAVTVHYPVTFGLRGSPQVGRDVQNTIERLAVLPGVSTAAATSGTVVGEGLFRKQVTVGGASIVADESSVTPGFFEAAGMSILQGRPLEARDENWRALVVNETFARAFWPESPALGQLIGRGTQYGEVVGIVGDAFDKALDIIPAPTIYTVLDPSTAVAPTYILSARGNVADHRGIIARTIASVNPDVVIGDIDTIRGRFANTVRDRTFATLVLAFFGIAAGAVTVAGLVGIVAFVVARRTREIAVRMALGAQRRDIRVLVIREALAAAACGGAAGLMLGRWLSTGLESFVYGLTPGSWSTALIAAAFMLLTMIAAAMVPARRAVNLQPSDALRVE
jgi:putative ABC transport system permease protein